MSQPGTTGTSSTGTSSSVAIDAAVEQGRAALIGYLPVGYPDVMTSVQAARAMVAGGVDVVELGLPYTDPLMDGPVIQEAVDAALAAGTRIRDVVSAVEQVAADGAPVLVMTYWNPVARYGVDRMAADLAAAGGAGLITPDLIPDEAGEWIGASDQHGLDRVFLVAPSSSPQRLASTAAACRGFVYAASTMGVTGARQQVGPAARGLVQAAREAGAGRVCGGLGVTTADQAGEVASFADGVIVGTAFVRCLLEARTPAEGVDAVHELAVALSAGVRRAAR